MCITRIFPFSSFRSGSYFFSFKLSFVGYCVARLPSSEELVIMDPDRRNNNHMTEAQRSALNALLYRTGDQSRDVVLVLATNRPSDLDSAITDRIDEVLEFPLPGEEERVKLLKLYLQKYIADTGTSAGGWKILFRQKQARIEIRGVTDEHIREAARKTDGFSGREIAKLMASMQSAVYGSNQSVLDADLFREVVDYKAAEHYQRRHLSAERHPSEGVNFASVA